MLTIVYGDMDGAIYNTALFFKNVYQDSWMEDPFAQRMIKSVDKSEVLGSHLIKAVCLVSSRLPIFPGA